MEFLLVSDIHAEEFNNFAKIDPATGMNTRLQWILDIFDQIYEYGEENGIRTLLIGGDVFDKRGTISVTVYDAVFRKMRLLFRDWVVLGVVGNHDQAIKSGGIHSLNPLPIGLLKAGDAVTINPPGQVFAGVPFCETPENFLEQLQRSADNKPDFYLIHQGVNGAKIAGDEILSRDETNLADIRAIVGPDAWVFSGHYHIHQFLDDRFVYIGSSTPKDFGDTTPKGFLHFKDGVITQIESRAPKFIVCDTSQEAPDFGLNGNYVHFLYEGDIAPDHFKKIGDQLSAAGWVASKKKVDRNYERRSHIRPEQSPMDIICNYVADFVNANGGKFDNTVELLQVLNGIVGTRTLEQNLGGRSVRFKKIVVKNFMSYKDAEVDFDSYRGLVSIEGENLDDPSATSNGSGKSLIPESLKWVLFGHTARGVASDDVVNRKVGKNCSVELFLEIDGKTAVVKRYRKDKEFKNQLFFDYVLEQNQIGADAIDLRGKTDAETQEKLIKEVGFDENTFDNTVFFGHNFTKSFAALPDKEQKQVLETILGVEYFTELYEKTKALSKEVEADLTEKTHTVAALKRQIEDSQTRVDGLSEKFEAWEAARSDRVSSQLHIVAEKNDYIKTMADNSQDESTLANLKRELAGLPNDGGAGDPTDELTAVRSKINTLKTTLAAQERDFIRQESAVQSIFNKAELLENRAEELKQSCSQNTCATCGQDLPKHLSERAHEEQDAVAAQVAALLDEADAGQAVLDTLQGLIDATESKIKEAQSEELERLKAFDAWRAGLTKVLDLKEKISALERKLDSVYSALASAKRAATVAQEWATKFESEENPLASELDIALTRLEGQTALLEGSQAAYNASKKSYDILKFWEAAFSDKGTPEQSPIKSYLFDAIVPVLDELSRVYSEILTSGSMEVQFNTVTALKSGELRDKFSVDVVNRYGADGYLGDSGGERRKVDLVIMFALHSLARLRSGANTNLLFLDEILDSLDAEGCSRVMDLLGQMTEEIDSIFVITHNDNLKTRFSNRLKVLKKDGISRLVN